MKSAILSILTLLIISAQSSSFAQHMFGRGWDEPKPEIGWDSLYKRIVYPELARRAGLECVIWTRVRFTAEGTIDSIFTAERGTLDQILFGDQVRRAILSTKWSHPPDTTNWDHADNWYSIPVYFFLSNTTKHHRIFIEAEQPYVPTQLVH